MKRRGFLTTVATTTMIAGCSEGENNSTSEPTKTPSSRFIEIRDHYFEKLGISDVEAFVTGHNFSPQDWRVEVAIPVVSGNERLQHGSGVIEEHPPQMVREENIVLPDLNKPERVTRYTLTAKLHLKWFAPIEMEFSGDEYRERLEGEWT